jgi:hypothetical protein
MLLRVGAVGAARLTVTFVTGMSWLLQTTTSGSIFVLNSLFNS